MSDKLLDALDNLNEDDDSGDDDGPDAQDVNDALGEDAQYWDSRNKANKLRDIADKKKDEEDDK